VYESAAEWQSDAAGGRATAPSRSRGAARFWHRLMLPLRPRSWRLAVVLLVAAGLLGAVPWHRLRHPLGVAAHPPDPGWRAGPRNWLALAHAVEKPSDFRPFEPVLEEVTGRPPLTHHAVAFHVAPRGRSGEVGSYTPRRIDLYGTAPYDRQDHAYMCPEVRVCGGVDLCRDSGGPTRTDWLRGRNVARWVHEQGHYYEGYPRGWLRTAERQLVSETAATALVFAFAEHLARDLSAPLAANLFLGQLVPVEGNTRFELSPRARREIRGALDDLPEDDAAIERVAAAAVLILRGSGIGSFREVWRFAHEHPAAEVAGRIRRHGHRLEEGFQLTVDAALAAGGGRPPRVSSNLRPGVLDPAALGPLRVLNREECLELWYARHVLSFCGHGRSARVDLRTIDPPVLVLRLATEGRDLCLLAENRAEGPGEALVFEEHETALFTTAAITTPCVCRADRTALRGEDGARALGEALTRLQAVIQRGLEDVAEAGGPFERVFAEEVVTRLAAELPDRAWPRR